MSRHVIPRVVVCLALTSVAGAQDIPAGAGEAIRTGQYAEAVASLSAVPRGDPAWIPAQRELVRALATLGRYDQAEAAGSAAIAAPGGREVLVPLGQVMALRGKRTEAESLFTRAMRERARDSLTAALEVAILWHDGGERERALGALDGFIDVYNSGRPLSSDDLVAVGTAVRYLGARDPQLFRDALMAFDRAIAADRRNQEAQVRVGSLFLEKYQADEAQRAFDAVLRVNRRHPGALLGSARRLMFDGRPGADSLVARVLELNADHVDARVLRAELLLDVEDHAGAQREIDRALRVNPASSRALAVGAAVRYAAGDERGFEQMRRRALELNQRDADLHATLAEMAARVRQYGPAAEFARQGVALDSTSWRAHGLLGMNLLRLGRIPEGRASLERAFGGDPYDVWIKNTLDLLDTFANYDEIRAGPLVLMIEKAESRLLSLYLEELGRRAHDTFAARYGYTPPEPVRVEVYRSHADFSVRTVGLAGLGALGVSFGPTVAFDSPAARDAGPFNWGSVFWHELAHTFTLGATNHRVPRWLSEGLSVFEERRARDGWGFNVTSQFLEAFAAGRLVPVSRLNDGFMRPSYPEQVQFSYYQASLVCELIVRDWGESVLGAMLRGYRDGMTNEQVFQRVLRTTPEAFDRRFTSYVEQRFAGALAALARPSPRLNPSASALELVQLANAAPGSLRAQLAAGRALVAQGEHARAIPILERARELFPEFGGGAGPYPPLATAYREVGNLRRAADVLAAYVRLGDSDLAAHLALADLLETLGDTAGAADALDRAMYIDPFDVTLHQRLAAMYQALGNRPMAIRERRAVVALDPVDRADAYYQLAVAYDEAGDVAQARRAVLRALEAAPNFDRAQALLLRLHDAQPRGAAEARRP